MFKLMIFLIVFFFILLMIYSGYKASKKSPHKKESEDRDLDIYINDLKAKIANTEIKAKVGVENAEAMLTEQKERLKKAEILKQKTKHL